MESIQAIKQRFGIIGNDTGLNRALEKTIQVAPTDISVLVTGESGVGKENIPKIAHQLSHRKHAKYIAVNCGAIPEGTIDSELFGHEKGAFTGATQSRNGYFEVADGGTIFLDEVGELPLTTQVRLLRVLENGYRIGTFQLKNNAEPYKMLFATESERDVMIQELNTNPDLKDKVKTDTIAVSHQPGQDFTQKVRNMQTGAAFEILQNLKDNKAPQEIQDSIMEIMLDSMPETSVLQMFRPREGVLGADANAMAVYETRMPTFAQQIVNLDYGIPLEKIDQQLLKEVEADGTQQVRDVYNNSIAPYLVFADNPTSKHLKESFSYCFKSYSKEYPAPFYQEYDALYQPNELCNPLQSKWGNQYQLPIHPNSKMYIIFPTISTEIFVIRLTFPFH